MSIIILVRYGEIALKGKNRAQFEQRLQRNLKTALSNCESDIKRMHGRIIINVPEEKKSEALRRLTKVFGVVSFSPVEEVALDLDTIKKTALAMLGRQPNLTTTFRVETRRVNKKFPQTSPQVSSLLGSFLQQHYPGLKVKLTNPSLTLTVELGYEKAYLFLERLPAPGGLPVGSSGRSLLLLSGGIDSPVAGWLAMKRGLSIEALHFHSFPFTGKRSLEKTIDLCRLMAQYCGKIPLHTISLTETQKDLRLKCPEELSIILLRRMMLRLAEKICESRHLQAIVTGENLGQVASQTIESITAISRAAQTLILRPLIGMDKREIIDLAEKIGTYETSILPYEDCCTLFLPKKPATRPKLEVLEKVEAKLDLNAMITTALETLETTIVKR